MRAEGCPVDDMYFKYPSVSASVCCTSGFLSSTFPLGWLKKNIKEDNFTEVDYKILL